MLKLRQMSLAKSIGKNTLIQLGGRLIAIFISFYIVILLTRYLGVESYGKYNTIIVYLNFFAVLADFGLYLIVAREMPKKEGKEKEKIFNNALSLRIVSAALFMAVSILIAQILPYDHEIKNGILIFALGMFFYLLNQVVITIFQVHIKTSAIAIGEVLGRALVLVGIYYIIHNNYGLATVMWFSAAGFALNFLVSFFFALGHLKIQIVADLKVWRYLILESWPIGVIIILISLFFRADAVFISLLPLNKVIFEPAKNLSNSFAVGIYGPVTRIVDALYLMPAIFLGLVLPQFSKSTITGVGRSKEFIEKAFSVMCYIALPLAFGLFGAAHLIIMVIAGAEFTNSVLPMQILAFSIGLNFISSVFYYLMIGVGGQKKLIRPYLIGFIFSLISNLILIQYFSYLGAAITSVATQAIILILSFILMKKSINFEVSFNRLGKILFASLVMSTVVFFSQKFFIDMIASNSFAIWVGTLALVIIVALITYGFLLWILKAIPEEFKVLFKKV